MEVILRGVWALLAGFAVMTALVFALTLLLAKKAPAFVGEAGKPRPPYIAVNVIYSFLAAAAGGYVAAWIARTDLLRIVLVLAVIVLVISAISAIEGRGRQPLAYQIVLIVITPLGVVAGGLLRLMMLGLV